MGRKKSARSIFCRPIRGLNSRWLPTHGCTVGYFQIFNIGGTEEVSMLELTKLVVKTLGSKSKIKLIPYDRAYAPGFDDMRRANRSWKNWNAS
jgi:nucleoside-diphosphate-sugar epimerase